MAQKMAIRRSSAVGDVRAAISEGRLFWGSGYSLFGTPNNKVYSFGLPD